MNALTIWCGNHLLVADSHVTSDETYEVHVLPDWAPAFGFAFNDDGSLSIGHWPDGEEWVELHHFAP